MSSAEEMASLLKSLEAEETERFSAVVSNPPYQIEMTSETGVRTSLSIFQDFQLIGSIIGEITSMIYPAGRWIQQSGKGMKAFAEEQFNDSSLMQISIFLAWGAESIFPGANIQDGVAAVMKNKRRNNGGSVLIDGFEVTLPLDFILPRDMRLYPLIAKMATSSNRFINERVSIRRLYGIDSNFVELNPSKVVITDRNSKKPPKHLSEPVKVWTNHVSGVPGRPKWYWIESKELVTSHGKLDRYQVLTQSGMKVQETGEVKWEIIGPGEAHGRVWASVADFPTMQEALNFKSYLTTPFMLKVVKQSMNGMTTFGSFIPDLENYTDSNPHINWTQPLDPQLYELFDLTEEEIAVIEGLND